MRCITLALLVALFASPSPTRGATVYVNRSATGEVHDGISWQTAFHAIQAGLRAAHPGDEVWVAGGTYAENVTLTAGVGLYGGFQGTETARDQRDWKANATILDGNLQGNVVTVPAGAPLSTVLNGFTVQHGNGIIYQPGQIAFRQGGGLYCVDASVTVVNCRFEHNTVVNGEYGGYGGGMYLRGGSAVIANNRFTDNAGSAIEADTVALDVRDNVAVSNDRGFSLSDGSFSVVNNTVTANRSVGLLLNATQLTPPARTVANNVISNNGGSGIEYYYSSSLVLSHNCVHGNVGPDYDVSWGPSAFGTAGNISMDPRFTSDGLHLRPDSPCVDTGDDSVAQAGETDLDGQPRIQGAHVDIGADEYDSSSTVPPPPPVVHVRPDGDDSRDGATWATAKRTPRAAIFDLAVAGGEIWVAAGTYAGNIEAPDKVALYGGFTGSEDRRDQRDPVAHETVLDGQRAGPVVIVAHGATNRAVLDGFTLRNGTGTAATQWAGGAVYSVGASPVIRNNRITGNKGSTGAGAGIFCEGGAPVIDANTISGNACSVGAAIDVMWSTATITRNTITGNAAAPFLIFATAPVKVFGGAVVLNGSTVNLFGNVIGNNTFYLDNGEYLTGGGGGLYCADSIVFAKNNVISGNSATVMGSDGSHALGGGVMMSGGTVFLVGNLITGNSLKGGGFNVLARGGGVYQDGGTLVLSNNTIAGNSLSGKGLPTTVLEGGGLYVDSSSDLATSCSAANNIVALNDTGVDWYGPAPSWSHNDVFGNGQDYPAAGPHLSGTDGNIASDPVFVNRNAGDFHLQPLSPCMDAGDDVSVRGAYDLDGKPRIQGMHVDMGAFEVAASGAFSIADLITVLRVTGGLSAASSAGLTRLNVVQTNGHRIDLLDAVRLIRSVSGLDPNP